MKKKNNLVVIALLVLLVGCSDSIDIRQPGRLDAENAFSTVTDLQLGLLGVYDQWDLTPEISLSANFCDEVSIGFDSGGQGLALYDFVLNAASDAARDFWVRNYRVNNRATLLIEAAANITPEANEQNQFNSILSQAHAIRAYANLELLTYFSPDPTNDNAPGTPVIDFIPGLDITPSRNTTGELWDYINSDLNLASTLSTEQSNTTFISRDAITAIRARAAITRGDYDTGATLASQLLASYPLANTTQYQLMFLDADNTEVILKLERTQNDNYDGQVNTGSVATGGGWAGSVFAFVDATITGGPYFEMDRSLFNALDPNDIRYTVNVAPTSIINPNYNTDPDPVNTDVIVIQKYQGSEGQPLMNDLKVFRSSEMLLILAEARAAQNNLTAAASLIDQLRDARFGSDQPTPSYGSQAEAFGAILDERRIELCFEGHRYKDLKRLGVSGNREISRDLTDCNNQSGACTLSANDYRFTLPIPIIEINANPGIGTEQNPGY
ncbi:RagB/SusD family nutrient uptake outer membrane protein [Ichthyenterobacterium sp. W332]|uniref:RagB/SusD family nutrient uptake outer membrane protein n=1 Tax=Microcosmobacter mediterraneus TaxID=3075607 RepID=A0ABU2YI94_9FLAO|nr:RagB/SusD family nutrient uptake outer membrane protein [Ichthyenterobacterium sp. W332]MDT0557490.1 RagB/SusD family nutrient uptake outer membrane protein [Ichthyenterobacterium sp. W332]